VLIGPGGVQDGPKIVLVRSFFRLVRLNIEKVIFRKNERHRGREHDLGGPSAPRSAQDGSKRLLKSNFFALQNRLKFGLVLGPILVDFGLPKRP